MNIKKQNIKKGHVFEFPACTLLKNQMLALTLLVIVFNRTSGGHLLDLPSAIFSWLERPQLVLLVADPGRGEASVVLWWTGGSRRRHSCRQVIPVRLNNNHTFWTSVLEKVTTQVSHTRLSDASLTFLSLWLRWSCFCRVPFWPVSVCHVDEPHHCSWGRSERVKILGGFEVKKLYLKKV